MPSNGIAGSYGSFIPSLFVFLRNPHALLHSSSHTLDWAAQYHQDDQVVLSMDGCAHSLEAHISPITPQVMLATFFSLNLSLFLFNCSGNAYLSRVLWRFNKMMYVEDFTECWAQSSRLVTEIVVGSAALSGR